ncbi:NAD-dependent succinate-semialdehyde dehydrogenase [Bacteroidota bacterium]
MIAKMNKLVSINPFSGEEIFSIEELSDKKLSDKVNLSKDSFISFRNTSFEYRKERMLRLAILLRKGAGSYAEILTAEMGKKIDEAIAEVNKCAWVCEYYAEHAQGFLEERILPSDAKESKVIYQPLGTVLAVMPWNFPFWQVFRFAAPTIMAANTALLKHASNVQLCAAAIEQLFLDAGFEEGVFQNLAIKAGKVAEVVASDTVKAVTVTGSEAAGAAVAGLAGKHLKKSVLELGGNNAFVVLNDADLDHAVDQAMIARLLNSGQSCIAAKRFILEKGIAEVFTKRLAEKVSRLKMGDPMDPKTDLAPLFSVVQAEEIKRQVNDAVDKGARLIHGGTMKGAFYDPTILCDVSPGMEVFDHETFGPVFAILEAQNPEHALELSNLSTFGLGMQVYTTSSKSAQYFIHNVEEGAVFVNDFVKSDPRLPFGGVKRSGFGRELAREGILEFVNCKTAVIGA